MSGPMHVHPKDTLKKIRDLAWKKVGPDKVIKIKGLRTEIIYLSNRTIMGIINIQNEMTLEMRWNLDEDERWDDPVAASIYDPFGGRYSYIEDIVNKMINWIEESR